MEKKKPLDGRGFGSGSGFKTSDWFAQYIIIILQKNFSIQIQGVQEKLCFLQLTATPPSPTSL